MSVRRLLNELDGQLGLGIHREPTVSEQWKGEAAELRNRITRALAVVEQTDALIRDLAALDPIRQRVTFGQGSFGDECRFCKANNVYGPSVTEVVHDETCVWARAVALEGN